MADRDQHKDAQAKRLDRDEPAVEDLEVRDEAADEVKGGVGSLNYTSVEQTYKGQ
jgi:hypothetical protein